MKVNKPDYSKKVAITSEFLNHLFEESINIFFEEESQNILDNVAERNLCGRLSIYLTQKLNYYKVDGYFADTEYNRKQGGQVKTILDNEMNVVTIQCDLIVHSRGQILGQDNLIAIEMKKFNRPEVEKISDRNRLRAMTKTSYDDIWSFDGTAHPEHVCGYKIGVYMIFDNSKRECQLEFYQKGQQVYSKIQSF